MTLHCLHIPQMPSISSSLRSLIPTHWGWLSPCVPTKPKSTPEEDNALAHLSPQVLCDIQQDVQTSLDNVLEPATSQVLKTLDCSADEESHASAVLSALRVAVNTYSPRVRKCQPRKAQFFTFSASHVRNSGRKRPAIDANVYYIPRRRLRLPWIGYNGKEGMPIGFLKRPCSEQAPPNMEADNFRRLPMEQMQSRERACASL